MGNAHAQPCRTVAKLNKTASAYAILRPDTAAQTVPIVQNMQTVAEPSALVTVTIPMGVWRSAIQKPGPKNASQKAHTKNIAHKRVEYLTKNLLTVIVHVWT